MQRARGPTKIGCCIGGPCPAFDPQTLCQQNGAAGRAATINTKLDAKIGHIIPI